MLRVLALTLALVSPSTLAFGNVPQLALEASNHAAEHYDAAQVDLLAKLVTFKTVYEEDTVNAEQPAFRAFAAEIERTAKAFGLDFRSYGAVLVVGLGDGEQRLGIVTHGDVQPADAGKWKKSPFELDRTSEPGKLIARGSEDDKAAIATALYAMKTLRETAYPLKRRIELIIALTEESDWDPFKEALTRYTPPQLNIGIDASYPVVVAEKGWGKTLVTFADMMAAATDLPVITTFTGGAFISQVPEDAIIEISNADAAMASRLKARSEADDSGAKYEFTASKGTLRIEVHGKAAHSSEPENGLNAISHAAALLCDETFAANEQSSAAAFINDLIGVGYLGKQFGDIAYSHDLMGPLTVNLSMVTETDDGLEVGINTRAPAGRSVDMLQQGIRAAVNGWVESHSVSPAIEFEMEEPYLPEQPDQVEPLLDVYRHFTGDKDAQAMSNSGATNARLLPNAVNFGPAMPGVPYTGHSEHEYITREQMTLNLKMYTAAFAWIAGEQ